MTTFPNSPRLLKGGIVLVDPDSGALLRVIALDGGIFHVGADAKPEQIGAPVADGCYWSVSR